MMGVPRLSLLRDTKAAAAAEFALILPMAFALIFTTMETGYYFQTEHKAIKYVREGSRFAARQNFAMFDCSGTGAYDNTATGADNTLTQIRNVTLTGQVNGGSARIAGWEATDINVTVSCDAAFGTGLYGGTEDVKAPVVTISTRFDYVSLLGLLGFDMTEIDVVAQAESSVVGI